MRITPLDVLRHDWRRVLAVAASIAAAVRLQLYDKRKYYPTLRDEEAVNPDAQPSGRLEIAACLASLPSRSEGPAVQPREELHTRVESG
jgi:hypothetical protein